MLGPINVSVNANSVSLINEVPVCSLSGYIDNQGVPSVNVAIQDKEKYLANQDVCDTDEKEFKSYLFSMIK